MKKIIRKNLQSISNWHFRQIKLCRRSIHKLNDLGDHRLVAYINQLYQKMDEHIQLANWFFEEAQRDNQAMHSQGRNSLLCHNRKNQGYSDRCRGCG